jgi:hypothetical protein
MDVDGEIKIHLQFGRIQQATKTGNGEKEREA